MGNQVIDISSCTALINIGISQESGAGKQQFDVSKWKEAYGANGTVKILHQRSYDELPYMPNNVVTEGNMVTWTFDSTDSAFPGYGLVTVIYTVGDNVVDKSAPYKTYTNPSVDGGSTEVPTAQQSWVQQVLEAADRAGRAASQAQHIIAGGTTGQVLTKLSDADYDYGWMDLPKYEGDFEITPAFLDIVLNTEGKFMGDDVRVKAITVQRVENDKRGNTITIGG